MLTPPSYVTPPLGTVVVGRNDISFFAEDGSHRDEATIRSFGEEWAKFNSFDEQEITLAGDQYFDIVPQALMGPNVLAMDLGCGSGRWTRYLAPRVGRIEAIDPSEAVLHAARIHHDLPNVRWTRAGVDNIPFADGTFDLLVCLGVLHHVPDTKGAVKKATAKLKPGGYMLIYLYYALDGRGPLYRMLFRMSDMLRSLIHMLPGKIKRIVCDLIALTVYLPLRTLARMARNLSGKNTWWTKLPLSYYHDKSMTVLRNDSLDRFGTPLEQRFTKEQIVEMMSNAGLTDIRTSDHPPYWHSLGRKV